MKKLTILFSICLILLFVGCSKQENADEETKKMETELRTLIDNFLKDYKPLEEKAYEAYWNASINSTDSNWALFAQYDMQMNKMFSDQDLFQKVKKIKESGKIQDSILKQELTVFYNSLLSKQADTNLLNQISKLTSEIELKYSNFRANYKGKKLSDNDVEEILKNSKNSKELEEVWKAHKEIGKVVSEDILKLVGLRNQLAKGLGFNNYHEMSLTLSGQDPKDVSALFDELDKLTHDAFVSLIKEINENIAKKVNKKPEELMPWHYQNRFFQEAPKIYEIDLDVYYKNQDLIKLTEQYYKSLNLPTEDILARSDLFEKPNKNQHAYCININREKRDIRILCNVKPTTRWMETMLHEMGHALYEKYYDDNLPWLLKTPAHIFTTEAVAMIFGRFATNPQWMLDMKVITPEEKEKIQPISQKILRMQQLVFSRWSQVMYRFEKAMYENPNQDLNKLWWDLVEKYQMIKRPPNRNMPDWATKIHIATSPCYYHNYLMGELLASQLYEYITTKILNKPNQIVSFYNEPKVGDFFREKIFSVGNKYHWNDMIEKATGEKLTAKYFAKQFVN